MIYYTGDLHFGHANVMRLCGRPFQTVEEMDEALIANWKRRVNTGDSVYILGDLALRAEPLAEHLRQMNGKKHLIVGNHDRRWLRRPELRGHFESVQPILFLPDGSRKYVLCHYPMMAWPHQRESYMVFGHIHNDTAMEFWPLIRRSPPSCSMPGWTSMALCPSLWMSCWRTTPGSRPLIERPEKRWTVLDRPVRTYI